MHLSHEKPAHDFSQDGTVPLSTCLVIGVHLGHHPFFQKVKSQDLKDIELMGHLSFDWAIPSDHMLEKQRQETGLN